jgi:hypothetical protein
LTRRMAAAQGFTVAVGVGVPVRVGLKVGVPVSVGVQVKLPHEAGIMTSMACLTPQMAVARM